MESPAPGLNASDGEARSIIADRWRIFGFREDLAPRKLSAQLYTYRSVVELLGRGAEDAGQAVLGEPSRQRVHGRAALAVQGVRIHGELSLPVVGDLFAELFERGIPGRRTGRCGRRTSGGESGSGPILPRLQEAVRAVDEVGLAGVVAAGDYREVTELQFGILDGAAVPERERERRSVRGNGAGHDVSSESSVAVFVHSGARPGNASDLRSARRLGRAQAPRTIPPGTVSAMTDPRTDRPTAASRGGCARSPRGGCSRRG